MDPAITAKIDELVEPLLAKKGENLNLVIGVLQGENRWTKGWGNFRSYDSDYNVVEPKVIIPPDGNTVFEIGSITKTFTSTLLSVLVERQELNLNSPINKMHTSYSNLPDNVTLFSLATHTSGLPRMLNNFKEASQKDPMNPYAAISLEDLHDYLCQHNGKPGKRSGKISYSNLGVGILGNILTDHGGGGGKDYQDVVLANLCHPLGLVDTSIHLSADQEQRFVVGYQINGQPAKPWDIPAMAGAGGFRSTANDMLTYLALQLGQLSVDGIPEEATARTHKLQVPYSLRSKIHKVLISIQKMGRRCFTTSRALWVETTLKGIGLGWFITHLPSIDRDVHWHNGGTGGYRTFCGFIKESNTAVVVLSNQRESLWSILFGPRWIDSVGFKILELMEPQN